MVDCCSFSICRTQRVEEEEWTWKVWRTFAWMNWLSSSFSDFFSKLTRSGRGHGQRWGKILCDVSKTHCTHYDACRRETGVSQRQMCEQEDWAAVSDSERIVQYSQDQSCPESNRTPRDFPRRLFLSCPLSDRTNGAHWCQQESTFLPCFS